MKRRNETDKQRDARLDAFERDALPIRRKAEAEAETRKCPNCDKLFLLGDKCRCGFSGKGIDVEHDTAWKLNRVSDTAWIQDTSGIVVYINWDTATQSVRLDVMLKDEPKQSFIGTADNVRKATMQWITDWPNSDIQISLEHAAYIGAELERCDTERIDYMQN